MWRNEVYICVAASGKSVPEILLAICTFNLVQEGMFPMFLDVSFTVCTQRIGLQFHSRLVKAK